VISGSLRYVTVLTDLVDRGNFETSPGAATISPIAVLDSSSSASTRKVEGNVGKGDGKYTPANSKYYNPRPPPPKDTHTNHQTQDHN
jgi:hypothetical protein